MAIQVSSILTRVNQITQRDLTDITSYVQEACNKIAIATGALTSKASGTLTSDQTTITAPTDISGDNAIFAMYIDDEIQNVITMDEWYNGNAYGYFVQGDKIYISVDASDNASYEFHYYRTHADVTSDGSLEFRDTFLPLVNYLTASLVYDDFEIEDRATYFMNKYEMELMKVDSGIGVASLNCERIR